MITWLLFARRGPNDESFGPRFFALNGLYDIRLRELARSAAKQVVLHSVSTLKHLKVYDGDATWNFSILPVCIIHDALYQIPKEYLIFAIFLCVHIWGYSISDKNFREEGLKEVVKKYIFYGQDDHKGWSAFCDFFLSMCKNIARIANAVQVTIWL